MDRLACVDVPAFPLQLLLRRHPDWRGHPVAVVAEDKPNGTILWVNEQARQHCILPGHRYAAGLSLATHLRAGVVSPAELDEGITTLTTLLLHFSPHVEPAAQEPGVFWVNASGLGSLYPSLGRWAQGIVTRLRDREFVVNVAVGFARFGTYALAKVARGVVIKDSAAEEHEDACKVPLNRLHLDPALRDALDRLGVHTLGEFLRLPAAGILKRFGAQAHFIHRLASGQHAPPLTAYHVPETFEAHVELESPETDTTRLLFFIKQALHPLLGRLYKAGKALLELRLSFTLQRDVAVVECIRPATPTLDDAQVLDLVRLRLETLALPSGATELKLHAVEVDAALEQLRCLVDKPRRDLQAAQRALARLRAEFGDKAVVRACLKDGHLPEASFEWVPLDQLVLPSPSAVAVRPLVRRILQKPVPLLAPPARLEDGWHLLGKGAGPVRRYTGPYVVSGGWWVRPVHREYVFAQVDRGDWVWIYFDGVRGRWFMQGSVG